MAMLLGDVINSITSSWVTYYDIIQRGASPLFETELNFWFQNPSKLIDFFRNQEQALVSTLLLCFLVTFLCWFFAEIHRNYSYVDKIWSITPAVYAIMYYMWNPTNIRLLIMAFLATLWGTRLSYNFWRKGGYTISGEDYRWPWLKERMNSLILWEIFAITFIAPYQNLLLWGLAAPMSIVSYQNTVVQVSDLTIYDFVCTGLFLALLFFEWLADEQQWQFHQRKTKFSLRQVSEKNDSEVERGFLSSGLFRYSRHPNFFCEMSLWWVFYSFSVVATNEWVNWSIIATFLLTLLFQGSTALTEYMSSSKYPDYKKYQKLTSRIIPLPTFGDLPPPKKNQ